MMPAFTERALAKQEPMIQFYTNLLMSGLSKKTRFSETAEEKAIVNIVDWFNWFAFDLLGELAFGESFGSLEETRHHPWVAMIFGSIKGKHTRSLAVEYALILSSSHGFRSSHAILRRS